MAEYHGIVDDIIAYATMYEEMNIGTTDTGLLYGDKHFPIVN